MLLQMVPLLRLGANVIAEGTLIVLGSKVISDKTFITFGSKCYHGWDLYYAWVNAYVQMVLQMEPLYLHTWYTSILYYPPLQRVFRPRGVLPYIGYMSMCGAKGYGLLAFLVWNRVSISTILVWKGVWFVHSSLELGIFLEEATSSSFSDETISLLMSVRQPCTCRNSLSRAPVTHRGPGLQVWNRVSNFWSGVK